MEQGASQTTVWVPDGVVGSSHPVDPETAARLDHRNTLLARLRRATHSRIGTFVRSRAVVVEML